MYPPAISNLGNLNLGNKSDLVCCIKEVIPESDDVLIFDAVIVDGAAMANMLQPGIARTFSEYAMQVIIPYLNRHLEKSEHLDVVFDCYITDSLKATARCKRGTGA